MTRICKNTMGMFDCLKGIIILFVIFFHSFIEIWGINNSTWYPIIWRIMYSLCGVTMGTLFVISGYGFRPVKTWKAFKNQFKLLLKPYFMAFVCSIFFRIPLNLFNHKPPFEGAVSRIIGCLLGQMGAVEFMGIQTESIFVFWYFLALLFGWMILSLIFYLCKSEVLRGTAVCICACIGFFTGKYLPDMPYCVTPTFLAIGFIYFGYILKKKKWLFCNIKLYFMIPIFIIASIILKYGNVNLSTGRMKLGMIDYFGTILCCFVLLRIYLFLFRTDWKIYRPFMFLGRNSSMIIAIHGFEHLTFQWRSLELLKTDTLLTTSLEFFVCRFGLILLIYFVIDYIKKKICSKKIKKIYH